jgi:hypothetical protein
LLKETVMGWEITDIRILEGAGSASVFQFEVAIADAYARHLLAGDGVVLDGSRVRVNRQAEIRRRLAAAGLDAEGFIGYLAAAVSSRVQDRLAAQSAA